MARTRARTRPRGRRPEDEVPARSTLRFTTKNWAILGAGSLALVLGYLLLAGGSTVAAPLMLVVGYVVLIPLGLMLRPRSEEDGAGSGSRPATADRGA